MNRYLTCPNCFNEPLQLVEIKKGVLSCVTCEAVAQIVLFKDEIGKLTAEWPVKAEKSD